MSDWREAHIPALKTEEAVQMPALARHPGGKAALSSALRSARAMGTIRAGAAVSTLPGEAKREAAARPAVSRAALGHVRRK